MLEIDKLAVFIDYGSSEMVLGQIVRNGKSYYFKYAEEYLNGGYNISPFKLRLDNSVQLPDTTIFEGLFGVFADSLPDGWGRLLTEVLEGINSWHDLSKQFDLSVNTKMLISKTINNNIKEFLDK